MMSSTTNSSLKKNELILLGILSLIAMLLTVVATVPALRGKVKDAFLSNERSILAKVEGRLSKDGPQIVALKVQSRNNLLVEVFSLTGNTANLMAKLPLFEVKDGYVLVKGNATNLALLDVDKDGVQEILAPTYDAQMIPRLNIFRYNSESESFDRVTAPDNFEP